MMGERELSQDATAGACEPNDYLAAIRLRRVADDVTAAFQAVNELNHAVMFELQPDGQLSDGRDGSRREPFEGEKQLVLLRLQPMRANLIVAETKKSADLAAELGQSAITSQR